MTSYPKIKLTYFDVAARAEATRLAFFMAQVPFQDERLASADFKALKPTLPFLQVPVLEVDGQVFAESHAILRYAGRLAKMYPVNDPLAAAKADEILITLDQVLQVLRPSFSESDPEKKREMREQLLAVALPREWALLDARLAKMQSMTAFSQIGIHDLAVYVSVEMFRSGFLDHIPTSLTDGFEHVMASFHKVTSHPKFIEWRSIQRPKSLKLKLSTSAVHCLADPIRLVLHLGGIEFEDERINQKDEFVLSANDERISYASPILQYAGILAGLYPANDLIIGLRIDEIFSVINDICSLYRAVDFEKDADKRAALAETTGTVKVPEYLRLLDARVAQWNATHAVSGSLTVADLAIFGLMKDHKSGERANAELFEQLVRIHDLVAAHPKVIEWYEAHQ